MVLRLRQNLSSSVFTTWKMHKIDSVVTAFLKSHFIFNPSQLPYLFFCLIAYVQWRWIGENSFNFQLVWESATFSSRKRQCILCTLCTHIRAYTHTHISVYLKKKWKERKNGPFFSEVRILFMWVVFLFLTTH